MKNKQMWDEFFRLYNEGLEEEFDKAMENLPDDSKFNNPEAFRHIRCQALINIGEWYKKRFDSLEGKTPEEILGLIKTPGEAAEIAGRAFEKCDDEIPEHLKTKLAGFGQEAIEEIEKMALDCIWESSGEAETEPGSELFRIQGALKILGEMQNISSAGEIITKFTENKRNHEFIADGVKEYFLKLDYLGIEILTESLNAVCESEEFFRPSHEDLLVCLTIVGKNNRIDEIYMCIRNCFNKMENKVIGAICIGDYGDPRGIFLLKGYLEKNQDMKDKNLFYESLSSIKRLGGDTNDIKDPFKDFS